jgi:hypothetical protein
MMEDDIAIAGACFAAILPAFLMIMHGGAESLPEEKKRFTWVSALVATTPAHRPQIPV